MVIVVVVIVVVGVVVVVVVVGVAVVVVVARGITFETWLMVFRQVAERGSGSRSRTVVVLGKQHAAVVTVASRSATPCPPTTTPAAVHKQLPVTEELSESEGGGPTSVSGRQG